MLPGELSRALACEVSWPVHAEVTSVPSMNAMSSTCTQTAARMTGGAIGRDRAVATLMATVTVVRRSARTRNRRRTHERPRNAPLQTHERLRARDS